jgi:hypothetical protein
VHTSADLVRELIDPSVATVTDKGDECELHFSTDDLGRLGGSPTSTSTST